MTSQDSILDSSQPPPAFRILTIVARPLDEPELPDIADAWALTDGLNQVEAPVYIQFLHPPTIETLRTALLDQWDIIHFDGHGAATSDGGLLAFEAEDGTFTPLTSREFVEMLSLSGSMPRIIILSACESASGLSGGLAGALIQAGVPAAIGTLESVTVEWTMALVRPLYAALGRGRTIQEAFSYARTALRSVVNPISNTPSSDLPVLLGTGINARLCQEDMRGRLHIEQPRLFNWAETWPGMFQGDYIESDQHGHKINPPEGRKGFIVQGLRALLRGEKYLAITGVGGIGKTALATVISKRIAWRFTGGVFWIDGRDFLTSTIPLDAVLNSFEPILGEGFLQLSTERKRERVRSYMNQLDSACLIVLDNADVISPEAARFLKELPPRSATLLTSREVPESGGAVITLSQMSTQESLHFLLIESGRRQNDPFKYLTMTDDGKLVATLSEEEYNALIEIAKLVEGHPLALLQAAALIGDDGFIRTLALVRAHPAQGKEIHERFDFSYTTLTREQKRLLHRLAAFPIDFTEVCVHIVCKAELSVEDNEALPSWQADLRVLRNKSLVEDRNIKTGIRRFRLHPITRDYVRAKSTALPLDTSLWGSSPSGTDLLHTNERHVALCFYMQAFAYYTADKTVEHPYWITEEMIRERANMLAALEIFITQQEWTLVIGFAYMLDELLTRIGNWSDRRSVLEKGLVAAKAIKKSDQSVEFAQMFNEIGETDATAELTRMLGKLAEDLADYAEAQRRYDEALKLARELNDKKLEAKLLRHIGTMLRRMGNYKLAHQLYRDSSKVAQETLDISAMESNTKEHIQIIKEAGYPTIARWLHKWLLKLQRRFGDKPAEFETFFELAWGAYEVKDYAKAQSWFEKALEVARRLSKRSREAQALHALGKVAQDTGNYIGARRRYEESLEIIRDLGIRSNEAYVLADFAMLNAAEGKYDESMELSLKAEEILLGLGNPIYIMQIRKEREILEKMMAENEL